MTDAHTDTQQAGQHVDDDLEEYNYEADKYATGSGKSGKHRTKKEVEQHTNRTDPCGHTRKTVQKLINNHENEKEEYKAAKAETAPKTAPNDAKHS